MKIKKYPQSHLLITGNNTKIIIDPGYITFEKGFKVEEFQGMDGYLITHQHADHVDPGKILEIVGDGRVYGNADVAVKLKDYGVEVVTIYNRKPFNIGEFEITPVDLPHFQVPGKEVPPNTGYLINGIFFHPGDGAEAPEELHSDNLALLIANPWISPGHYEEAIEFAKNLQAKLVIPIHYDSKYPADVEEFVQTGRDARLEVRALNWGEETTI